MNNEQKNFRKMFLSERDHSKCINIISQFINESLPLDIPKKNNFISSFFSKFPKKSKIHTEIVICELEKYTKKYHDFDFLNLLYNHQQKHPELYKRSVNYVF